MRKCLEVEEAFSLFLGWDLSLPFHSYFNSFVILSSVPQMGKGDFHSFCHHRNIDSVNSQKSKSLYHTSKPKKKKKIHLNSLERLSGLLLIPIGQCKVLLGSHRFLIAQVMYQLNREFFSYFLSSITLSLEIILLNIRINFLSLHCVHCSPSIHALGKKISTLPMRGEKQSNCPI